MVRESRNFRGYTLTEMMIVVAILGIMITVIPNLYTQVRRFFFINNARVELQRDARNVMSVITRRIRQARSSTVVIDRATSAQPYYSRVSFTDIEGRNVTFYQNNKKLFAVDGATNTLTTNVRHFAIALPRSDDMGIISVSFTLEKSIYQGRTKALHMASERVRIMN